MIGSLTVNSIADGFEFSACRMPVCQSLFHVCDRCQLVLLCRMELILLTAIQHPRAVERFRSWQLCEQGIHRQRRGVQCVPDFLRPLFCRCLPLPAPGDSRASKLFLLISQAMQTLKS